MRARAPLCPNDGATGEPPVTAGLRRDEGSMRFRLTEIAPLLLVGALAVFFCRTAGAQVVRGVVTERASRAPVAGVLVTLVADSSNAAGQIGPGGAFRIQDPLGRDGAPAGAYRVLVLPPEGADRRRPPIDPRYGRYDTSGIEVTVKPQKNNVTVVVGKRDGKER